MPDRPLPEITELRDRVMSVRQERRGGDGIELPRLPLARYRLRFQVAGEGRLPAYRGSAWRGVLGHALKKTVCVTRLDSCPSCLLYRSCPYPYIFETPPPLGAKKMRKYSAAPHPFLLELSQAGKGGLEEVGLTLIGHGNRFLAYLIHAFQRAGERGLGKDRVPMVLCDVSQTRVPEENSWVSVYRPGGVLQAYPPVVPRLPPAPSSLTLQLQTPLRLQSRGRLVTPRSFQFSDLFSTLLRRVSMLSYFHTDTPLETDFAGLVSKSRAVTPRAVTLAWKEWPRYSSRQKTSMQMGGLLGEIVLDLEEGSPFWPYLWLGQWVHAGKGTSMGLGQFTIRSASLPDRGPAQT